MSISIIYRAEVQIPQGVFKKFGHTKEYERRSMSIYNASGASVCGQDTYSEVFEWAEDSERKGCASFEEMWLKYIKEMEELK